MLSTLLIQSNCFEMDLLEKTLADISRGIKIEARLTSVRDSVKYIATHSQPDLIFTDVQLSDGLSTEIFAYTDSIIPTVFISSSGKLQDIDDAHLGIDYIISPFKKKDIEKALQKFYKLKTHFTGLHTNFVNSGVDVASLSKRKLLVQTGSENIVVHCEDIALILLQKKKVYVLDHFLTRYSINKTMSELGSLLPRRTFFRANRQCFINIDFIKSFSSFEKVKLQVFLNNSKLDYTIIISQGNAPKFKRWIQQA